MIKNLWLFKKSTFLILLTSLSLVSGLFIFLFYKKIDESQTSISSYIRQRQNELGENILQNKDIKATSDAFMVLKNFNVLAYEVYYGKKLVFNWPENSQELLSACERPFEEDVTFRGLQVGPVKTCLSTTALVKGTFSTTTFALTFCIILCLFAFIALQPLMGYKKSLNTTIDILKKWNENPALKVPIKSNDPETNKIIDLLASGIDARVELSEVQTQLGMEKEISRFIKTLAHDLKEPVYNNQKYAEIIKEKVQLKEFDFIDNNFVNLMSSNNQRVNDIISDLMETHKNESIFIKKKIEKTDIVPSCKELIEAVQRVNPDVCLAVDISENLFLEVNLKEFKRVLSNVLKNSIEALDKNSKSIKIIIKEVNNQVLLSIEDNGKGIASHDLPKVFDEHFSKGKVNGNGLGLYYVKKMINSWGGTITIDSSLGSGTNVKIGFLQPELRG